MVLLDLIHSVWSAIQVHNVLVRRRHHDGLAAVLARMTHVAPEPVGVDDEGLNAGRKAVGVWRRSGRVVSTHDRGSGAVDVNAPQEIPNQVRDLFSGHG